MAITTTKGTDTNTNEQKEQHSTMINREMATCSAKVDHSDADETNRRTADSANSKHSGHSVAQPRNTKSGSFPRIGNDSGLSQSLDSSKESERQREAATAKHGHSDGEDVTLDHTFSTTGRDVVTSMTADDGKQSEAPGENEM